MREELERRGLKRGIDFCPQYGLRSSFILDFAFPMQKVCVETDGEVWHDTPEGRKRDWWKDHVLKNKLGWKVLRFKGQRVLDDVVGCVDEVMGTIGV